MTDFDNIDDLVARYLRRDLDAEQLADVDNRRRTDPAFAEEFETGRLAFILREQLIANDLSGKMKRWRNDAPPPPEDFFKKYRYWIWAAFLLLCNSVAVWYFMPKTPIVPSAAPPTQEKAQNTPPTGTPETPMAGAERKKETTPPAQHKNNSAKYAALATRFYNQPDFNKNIRGNSSSAAGPLENVTAAMAGKKWNDALQAISQLPPEYKSDGDYLKAHILFNQKKYNEAAAVFGSLKSSVRYGEAAQWYEILALMPTYSDQRQTVVHQMLMALVKDDGHTYQKEAKNLADVLR